ncbi:proline-rich protein 5-like isoform X2 [Hemitrygon akajei]|uniref:proline-rich protein 5-like isoform X2 n=1 Tax=Hemitrygon akajei TaxID=2704970 RepID=UPI003BF98297
MGSFRKPRPRFLSSPVLSDLPQFHAARQAALLGSNKAWNSVHKAVIKVFQGGSLQDNELYSLNENIRQLLKSELGPFITDYFQNHLLSKGLILMEEKMRVCEGENLLEALTRIWDHFFTEILPMLQAIFYPVQGAHEPKGPTEEYIQLEHLVQLVVSPYLGLYELLPRDRSIANTVCLLDRRFAGPKSKAVDALTDVCEVTASNETMLTPLIEQEGETYLEKCGSLRRHTVANAPTELQLLAMSSMLHPSLREEANSEDKRLLTQPNRNHKHYSSGLNVPEIESEFMNLSPEKTLDMKCTAFGSISK